MEPDIFQNLIAFAPPFAPPPPVDGAAATGTWGGLIFYITIALGISFLCSILEAVLLSTSHSYSELQAEQGKRAGLLMQKHKADVERPISAILTLNTIAHTVGAAGAGAEAVGIFGSQWFGVISAVLTFLILVFSEIIPKTVGATYWKQLNGFAAYAIQFLVLILFPAVWFLEKATQLLKSDEEQPTVSRTELEVMARIGETEGALHEQESRIMQNLLHLRNVQVHDVMTPRTVVLAFSHDVTVKEVVDENPSLPYSRIPIYREQIDDVAGFVLRHDILQAYTNDEQDKPLIDFKRDIGVVPENNTVASVLDEFVQKREHIMLVIDEYGGTAGILTMEDALETLLGIEITDESDLTEDLREMASQRYQRQVKLLERVNAISKPNPKPDPADSNPAQGNPGGMPSQVPSSGS